MMSLEEQSSALAVAQNIQQHGHIRSGSAAGNDEFMATSSHPQRQDLCLSQAASGNPVSIAIDPVALITTECITVTSAMRKHTRWAQSSVSAILGGGTSVSNGRDSNASSRGKDKASSPSRLPQRTKIADGGLEGGDGTLAIRWGLRGKRGKSIQDNPLISAFARLRYDLRGCRGQRLWH